MLRNRKTLPLFGLLLFPLAAPAQDPGLEERLDLILERLDRLEESIDQLQGQRVVEFDAPLEETTSPEQRLQWFADHQRLQESPDLADRRWHFLGPTNVSGRVTDVAVTTPRGKTYTVYIATASGGVWKTSNEGVTWKSIFDHQPTQSIGDVSLAPSDQQQVWIGTGEPNIFRSSMAGCGVYKSMDGGETWQHKGLAATHTISRIVVHPTNPDVVYVAASGHEWTDNPERGVYRTTDGGDTWELVLHISSQSGAIDFAMDPVKPEIIYASTWQRKRERWNDPRTFADHTDSGIWRSTDGGDSWQNASTGLPAPHHRGRIGIDVAASNPNVVYAFVDNYELQKSEDENISKDSYGRDRTARIKGGEVYRSDDRAQTWRKVSKSDNYMANIGSTYGWVFGQIRVDPSDEDTIYIMGLSLHVSHDGGETWGRLGGMHSDHHGLWIDPNNSDYLINNNDGGVNISYDGGKNWRFFTEHIPVVQFYNVGYDMATPFNVYGSIQDHGSRKGEVNVDAIRAKPGQGGRRWGGRGRGGRSATVEWDYTSGGEASFHAVDPSNPDTLYYAGFYGSIGRTDQESGERARLKLDTGIEGEEIRGQWLAPFIISPHNPRVIYHGMNRLFRSMDQGENFTPISPDLSRNLESELGDIPYQTITAISESPYEFGRIFAGTDDGRLHVTFDSGKEWQRIDGGMKEDRWISRVIASKWTDGVVYAAQNGKRWDDLAAYLWKSDDNGKTWSSIAAGLPGAPVNVIREDPRDSNVLYVGTDLGVYISRDRGATWNTIGSKLPTLYVHDLIIHPRDEIMVIATHGRGMWAIDVREPEEEVEEPVVKDEEREV
ncbi:MAG: hypothetical protein H8E15_02325 [Planctomycetes bacterium]|nr:hypothetical protein [Planctomycetota bacterium]